MTSCKKETPKKQTTFWKNDWKSWQRDRWRKKSHFICLSSSLESFLHKKVERGWCSSDFISVLWMRPIRVSNMNYDIDSMPTDVILTDKFDLFPFSPLPSFLLSLSLSHSIFHSLSSSGLSLSLPLSLSLSHSLFLTANALSHTHSHTHTLSLFITLTPLFFLPRCSSHLNLD